MPQKSVINVMTTLTLCLTEAVQIQILSANSQNEADVYNISLICCLTSCCTYIVVAGTYKYNFSKKNSFVIYINRHHQSVQIYFGVV
jgi:hypothetical protein